MKNIQLILQCSFLSPCSPRFSSFLSVRHEALVSIADFKQLLGKNGKTKREEKISHKNSGQECVLRLILESYIFIGNTFENKTKQNKTILYCGIH